MPINLSGTSVTSRSSGSSFLPFSARTTISGLPTINSKPSRRIVSIRMASCSSPRPSTRNDSGVSVSSTRIETLVISSFAPAEGASIDGENHCQRRFVDVQWLQRRGVFERGHALTDLDAFHSGNRHDVTGHRGFRFIALQPAEREEFGDSGRFDFSTQLPDAHI